VEFPRTLPTFVLLWAFAALPGFVALYLMAPDWLVVAWSAVAVALLAGGIQTLAQDEPNDGELGDRQR
jgi:hypothetical protein